MPIPERNESIKQRSVKQIVFDQVLDWIINGTLEPGERIIDADLATYFGVSRTPVREALLDLEKLELVEIFPSAGTRVSEINWEDVQQNYYMLTRLQGLATRMATLNISEDDIFELTKLNYEFKSAIKRKSAAERNNADEAFHKLIIERADNKYLSDFLEQLNLRAKRIEYIFFNDKLFEGNSPEQHEAIIEALKAKDPAAAEAAAIANWESSAEKAREIYQNQKNSGAQ